MTSLYGKVYFCLVFCLFSVRIFWSCALVIIIYLCYKVLFHFSRYPSHSHRILIVLQMVRTPGHDLTAGVVQKRLFNRSMSVESSESGLSGTNSNTNINNSGMNNSNALGNSSGSEGLPDIRINGENKDKKKEKDKAKTGKQMHSVVKSFGSIGKTMSKKLKNLGGLKTVKLDGGKGDKLHKPAVGSATQSTNTALVTNDLLKDKDHVLCSKLLHKRLGYQEEMVQNYLAAAHESFEQDRSLRKQQDEEMRRITERRRLEQETPVPCINASCKQLGTPAMSYLCRECYDKQRKEAMDMEHKPEKSEVDGPLNTKVAHSNEKVRDSVTPELQRQNTIVNLGSSKFYTYADEVQSLPQSKYDNLSNNVLSSHPNMNNSSAIGRDKVRKAPLELSRSSFYDESLTSSSRALGKSSSPGTARIINNLKEEDFSSGVMDGSERDYISYHSERPKPIVETRQNVINLNTMEYQNRSNVYVPKVQNAPQSQQKEPSQFSTNTAVKSANSESQYVVNSSNISGKFVSRIEVGHSPSAEHPPRQKCRNDSCQGTASEEKEYYCGKCYQLYERNRTTFL